MSVFRYIIIEAARKKILKNDKSTAATTHIRLRNHKANENIISGKSASPQKDHGKKYSISFRDEYEKNNARIADINVKAHISMTDI